MAVSVASRGPGAGAPSRRVRLLVVRIGETGAAGDARAWLELEAQDRRGPAVAPHPDREILRLRGCAPRHCAEWGRPSLDKHRLDLALSAGRHAAERAKLAGVDHLVALIDARDGHVRVAAPVVPMPRRIEHADARACLAPCGVASRCARPCPCDESVAGSGVADAHYEALARCGLGALGVLVGATIASAQLGIRIRLPGRAGLRAARAAIGLNPGVTQWLVELSDQSREPVEHGCGHAGMGLDVSARPQDHAGHPVVAGVPGPMGLPDPPRPLPLHPS